MRDIEHGVTKRMLSELFSSLEIRNVFVRKLQEKDKEKNQCCVEKYVMIRKAKFIEIKGVCYDT